MAPTGAPDSRNESVFMANRTISSFSDWSVQLSRAWKGIDLDLIYSDSSLSGGGSWQRKSDLTIAVAIKRLQAELDAMGARYPGSWSQVQV